MLFGGVGSIVGTFVGAFIGTACAWCSTGMVFVQDGFHGAPPMMARVLVCLIISDAGGLTVADVIERLQVSPASISKAIQWLEQRELVRRERDNRRERYFIDEYIWYRPWLAATRSMTLWGDAARQGADVLGAGTPAGARLHTASRFFRLLSHDMAQAAEHYRQTLSGTGNVTH